MRRGKKSTIVHLPELQELNTVAPGPDGSLALTSFTGDGDPAQRFTGLYWPKTKKREPLGNVFPKKADLHTMFFAPTLARLVSVRLDGAYVDRSHKTW